MCRTIAPAAVPTTTAPQGIVGSVTGLGVGVGALQSLKRTEQSVRRALQSTEQESDLQMGKRCDGHLRSVYSSEIHDTVW